MQKHKIEPGDTYQIPVDYAAKIASLNTLVDSDPTRVIHEGECLLEQGAQDVTMSVRQQMHVLFLCSQASLYLDDIQQMDHYSNRCRQLSDHLTRPEDRGWYLGHIAVNAHLNGQVDEAIAYAEQAVALADESGMDDIAIYQSLHFLALTHYELGRYDIALLYSQRQQRSVQNRPSTQRDCRFYHNLGNLYMKLHRSEDAAQSFKESIRLARKGNLQIPLAMALSAIGNLYYEMGQMDKAFECVSKSISLAKASSLEDLTGLNTVLLARIHIDRNKEGAARQLLVHHLENSRDDLFRYNIKAECLEQLGMMQQRNGSSDAAREYFSRMMDVAVAAGLRDKQAEACLRLSQLEEHSGNYDRALEYHKIASQVWHEPGKTEMQRRITAISALQQSRPAAPKKPIQMGDPEILQILHTVSMSGNTGISPVNVNNHVNGELHAENLAEDSYAFLAELKRKLLIQASELTATEIRICLMIACGLQSKEIAALLVNSVTTINTHRRHIRKKLQLPVGNNLATYFTTL